MLTILEQIHGSPYLQQRLALKGGTALQGVVFGFKRLSIDIDLHYIGSLDRTIGLDERVKIRALLVLLFEDMGYLVELTGWRYAEEQFDLRFINCGGVPDRIKVEINYLERLPVLGIRQGRISHLFSDLEPVEVLTLTREELFVGKLRALVQRGTARDLFDAHLISMDQERTDMVRLRATFLLYMAMVEVDGRAISLEAVRKIDEKGARDVLVPMLPRSAKVDLSEMMSGVESLMGPMLVLTDEERVL